MHAIIDINGKQYQVEEGRYLVVDRLDKKDNEQFDVKNVVLVVDGSSSLVGAPYVDGATVKAKVLSHLRGKKQIVYKMRPKKGYRRKQGHRQELTKLHIEVIDFPGKKASAKKPAEKPAEKDKKETKKSAAPKADNKETAKKPAAKKESKTTKASAATTEKKSDAKPAAKKAAPKKETKASAKTSKKKD